MAKVPKHRRIKRATVLIKRTRCIRNTKTKSYSPLYQKLKVNNHSLAKALSQEKQESQFLFLRNNELAAEVQDLIHACNTRDLVISNVLKNAKDMMQMLVTMSGFLTNTISSCQEFVQNQANTQRTSTSSTGRRESIRRLSTKSPARGVVKPMVSGHTITKPTINLSRVNMQRLQNVNLSIIEEGSSTPERTLDRSVENRRSRTLPERHPVPALRSEEDEERVIVNRRTSRFSSGRVSSGRYSKRNSGRLSGGGLSSRLSKRNSEGAELIKSPRVALQDVSRYLTNNQSINIRLLSETTNVNQTTDPSTVVEDTHMMSEQSSPETLNHATLIPETQESCDTDSNDSEEETVNETVRSKKSKTVAEKRRTSSKKSQSNRSSRLESETIDPLEGSSWMHNSAMDLSPTVQSSSATATKTTVLENGGSEGDETQSSPVSSLSERRRRTTYFRVPELPKGFTTATVSTLNISDDYAASPTLGLSRNSVLDVTTRFPTNENDDDDDDDDHRVNLRFITQRRGPSARGASTNSHRSGNNDDDDDDDEEDDDTLMINMQRQLRAQQTPRHAPQSEQPERLNFDMNELLQLTPLKPLLNMMGRNNELAPQVDPDPEPTATMPITQKCPRPADYSETIGNKPTAKVNSTYWERAASSSTRNNELSNGAHERISDITTERLSSRIELPRLTDMLNMTEDNHPLTPESNKPQEVQKRKRVVMRSVEATHSASEENEEEIPLQNTKKRKQRKKKTTDKDPSAAKVVLEKLNESHRSSQNESIRSERKNSDESGSSMRNSVMSHIDHSSDSESSTASSSSKQILTRPRRQKAPTTFQEPSLKRKLRR